MHVISVQTVGHLLKADLTDNDLQLDFDMWVGPRRSARAVAMTS
jgi:hypothetical protein